jgi:hypothetical protein
MHGSTIVALPKIVFQQVSNPRKVGRINKFNTIAMSINHRRKQTRHSSAGVKYDR